MNILVVVDMQNDFITGALRNEEAIKIVPYVMNKVKRATEDKNTVVVFTRDTHGKDYMSTVEGKNLPVPHCIFKTPGWEIIDELSLFINEDTEIFDKQTFGSVNLLDYMDAHKTEIESVEFIGVCTDICVISNVMLTKAVIPNAEITVDAAGCAGTSLDNHDTALSSMESCHIKIVNKGKELWREPNEDLGVKIPKEISELLDKRYELASELVTVNNKLDDFLAKHNADFDCPCLKHSTHLGYTIFEDPAEAKRNIINYIEDEL